MVKNMRMLRRLLVAGLLVAATQGATSAMSTPALASGGDGDGLPAATVITAVITAPDEVGGAPMSGRHSPAGESLSSRDGGDDDATMKQSVMWKSAVLGEDDAAAGRTDDLDSSSVEGDEYGNADDHGSAVVRASDDEDDEEEEQDDAAVGAKGRALAEFCQAWRTAVVESSKYVDSAAITCDEEFSALMDQLGQPYSGVNRATLKAAVGVFLNWYFVDHLQITTGDDEGYKLYDDDESLQSAVAAQRAILVTALQGEEISLDEGAANVFADAIFGCVTINHAQVDEENSDDASSHSSSGRGLPGDRSGRYAMQSPVPSLAPDGAALSLPGGGDDVPVHRRMRHHSPMLRVDSPRLDVDEMNRVIDGIAHLSLTSATEEEAAAAVLALMEELANILCIPGMGAALYGPVAARISYLSDGEREDESRALSFANALDASLSQSFVEILQALGVSANKAAAFSKALKDVLGYVKEHPRPQSVAGDGDGGSSSAAAPQVGGGEKKQAEYRRSRSPLLPTRQCCMRTVPVVMLVAVLAMLVEFMNVATRCVNK